MVLKKNGLAFVMTLCAVFILSLPVYSKSALNTLSELEWQNRLVLVKIDDSDAVLALFNKYREAIDERHIIWFVQNHNQLLSNYPGELSNSLKEEIGRYTMESDLANMILIGKDGYVKSRNNGLNIESIFEQIDQMPMRRYEMQQQAN